MTTDSVRAAQVLRPARTTYIAETACNNDYLTYYHEPLNDATYLRAGIAGRHSNAANFVHMDGHVSTRKIASLPFYSRSPQGYYLFMNAFWRPWPSNDDTRNKNFYYGN